MSFDVPAQRHYLPTHEWADVDGGTARVGITDFAQDELGDVVFVEFPEVGTALAAGEQFGVIESIKAVSDLYAPVAGEVVGVNEAIEERPELVNEDPYGEGWLIEIDLAEDPGLDGTISADEYREQTE